MQEYTLKAIRNTTVDYFNIQKILESVEKCYSDDVEVIIKTRRHIDEGIAVKEKSKIIFNRFELRRILESILEQKNLDIERSIKGIKEM